MPPRCEILPLRVKFTWRYGAAAHLLTGILFTARAVPDYPCITLLQDLEWRALYMITLKQKVPDNYTPSIKDVTLWIAGQGGYLARTNDGPPCTIVLWRGLAHRDDYVRAFELIQLVGNC